MKMKKLIAAMIAAAAILLSACGTAPTDSLKSQLVSAPWHVQLSEGTHASYTFAKDGAFACHASAEAGGRRAEMDKDGTYEIVQAGDGTLTVLLTFPGTDYPAEITCREDGGSFALSIAGCEMYQE